MSSTSMPSRFRTPGALLVRKTSARLREPMNDVLAFRRREVQGDAALAPVGVLEQDVHGAVERLPAGDDQTAHRVAALDVLDLDDVCTPVGEHRGRNRYEGLLRDLENADTRHHARHVLGASHWFAPTGFGHARSMTLHRQRFGRVEVLTIDRPEVRNALDPETLHALADAIDELSADEEVGAAVLTGAGTVCFTAGMDLRSVRDRSREEVSAAVRRFQSVMRSGQRCRSSPRWLA